MPWPTIRPAQFNSSCWERCAGNLDRPVEEHQVLLFANTVELGRTVAAGTLRVLDHFEKIEVGELAAESALVELLPTHHKYLSTLINFSKFGVK